MRKIYGIICFLLFWISHSTAQEIKGIRIGDQVWMTKNLNLSTPGSDFYNHDEALEKRYGRLYTWEAAQDACPTGWHLPSRRDWEELINFLGGENTAGKRLSIGGDTGFNAMLGGFANLSKCVLLDLYGAYWSSDPYNDTQAWYYYLNSKQSILTKTYCSMNYKLSVRCIKN